MTSPAVEKRSDVGTLAAVAPVSLWQSLLLFGIPAVLFRLVLYNGTGWLVAHVVAEVVAGILAFFVPSVLLLVAALLAFVIDGYSLSWPVLRDRFSFRRMTGRGWLWVLGGTLVTLVGA